MDRVYLSSPKVIAVLDHEKKRTYVIRKEGLPDAGKLTYILGITRSHTKRRLLKAFLGTYHNHNQCFNDEWTN